LDSWLSSHLIVGRQFLLVRLLNELNHVQSLCNSHHLAVLPKFVVERLAEDVLVLYRSLVALKVSLVFDAALDYFFSPCRTDNTIFAQEAISAALFVNL
jgi:hypothetical protein